MNIRILIAAASALCITGVAQAEGDAAAGKAPYAVCTACHGANGEGNQALGAPRLAGLSHAYAARQINNFKAGIRGADPKDTFGAQMMPMAQTLADDAAIANVLAYIDTLKSDKPAATIEGDADAGKGLYATCAACHGANGEGNEALNAPGLAGQQDWYIARQLANYKSGLRGTHEKDTFGAQMRPMAMILADEAAINNVAVYIATFD